MSFNPENFLPADFLPQDFLPDAASAPAYPGISDRCRISLPSGGIWLVDPNAEDYCEIDWAGSMPSGVTLASVAYSLPLGLTNEGEAIDTVNGKSAIRVDGTAHSKLYAVRVVATLSSQSTLVCIAPLRSFNS